MMTAVEWARIQTISQVTSPVLAEMERQALSAHPLVLAEITAVVDRFHQAATTRQQRHGGASLTADAEQVYANKAARSGVGVASVLATALAVLAAAFTAGGSIPGNSFRAAHFALSTTLIEVFIVLAAILSIIAFLTGLRRRLRPPGVSGVFLALAAAFVLFGDAALASLMPGQDVSVIAIGAGICLASTVLRTIVWLAVHAAWSRQNAAFLNTFLPFRDSVVELYDASRDELAAATSALGAAELGQVQKDRDKAFWVLLRDRRLVSMPIISDRRLGELVLYAEAESFLGAQHAPAAIPS